MPDPVQVRVIKDTATPALRVMISRSGRPLLAALGKRLEVTLRQYFKVRGQRPHKRGWPKQHFWDRRIRNATALASVTETNATVNIADPAFNTHYFGGVIRPKEKEMLAIPLRAEAYGIQPSSGLIPGLFVIRRKGRKNAFLAVRDEDGALRLYYLLTKSVTVPRDPEALPPDRDINAALERESERFLARRQAP